MSDRVLINKQELVNIADAVRKKTGVTGSLKVNELDERIAQIANEEGIVLPPLNNAGAAADLLAGKEMIGAGGAKITGTMPPRFAEDVVVSGNTVTTTAGYYATDVSKTVDAGVELPDLSNEGQASELFAGKQLIGQDGDVVTGTFTVANEISAQSSLISQINAALEGKAAGGSGGGGGAIETCTVTVTKTLMDHLLIAYTSLANDTVCSMIEEMLPTDPNDVNTCELSVVKGSCLTILEMAIIFGGSKFSTSSLTTNGNITTMKQVMEAISCEDAYWVFNVTGDCSINYV